MNIYTKYTFYTYIFMHEQNLKYLSGVKEISCHSDFTNEVDK